MVRQIFRIPRVHFRRVLLSVASCFCCYYIASMLLSSTQQKAVQQNAVQTRQVTTTRNQTVAPPPKATTTPDPYLCPEEPTFRNPTFRLKLDNTTYEELLREVGYRMEHGGHFRPSTCVSREHLAIIIPYRDRERNLLVLLRNLLPFLWLQLIEFTVFLIEQTAEQPFNKGVLFNAAYREIQKSSNVTCFIMQDVDLIPMDLRNLYRCANLPRHLCLTSGQTSWPSKLMYPMTFGGAIALRAEHIEKANGFSVSYYGWGLEDDDLALRLNKRHLRIVRYSPLQVGKYYKMDHERMPYNPQWHKLKKSLRARQNSEGLNTLKYTLVRREDKPLYTHLLIRVPPPPPDIYGSPDIDPPKPAAKKTS